MNKQNIYSRNCETTNKQNVLRTLQRSRFLLILNPPSRSPVDIRNAAIGFSTIARFACGKRRITASVRNGWFVEMLYKN